MRSKTPELDSDATEGAAGGEKPQANLSDGRDSLVTESTTRLAYQWVRRHSFVLVVVAIVVAAAIGKTNLFVSGLVLGTALALGALGLTLTYGILKFPNLAHGMSMVVAGYSAFFLYTGLVRRSASSFNDIVVPWNFGALPGASEPFLGLSFGYGFILALIAAAIFSIGLALLFDWLIYRRLRRRKQTSVLMLTIVSFGVTFVLIGIVDSLWGLNPRNITPNITQAHTFVFGITLTNDKLVVFAVAAILTAAIAYFLYRTRLGRMMRAMSDNPDLAKVSGINVEHVVRVHWILVGLVIGVSGTLLGLISPLNPQLGLSLLLPLFAAAAVGGFGNPVGALIGGLTIGIAEQVSVAFVTPEYQVGVAFLILVLVLLFRPTGLIGARQ